jgi:hypothetical protein
MTDHRQAAESDLMSHDESYFFVMSREDTKVLTCDFCNQVCIVWSNAKTLFIAYPEVVYRTSNVFKNVSLGPKTYNRDFWVVTLFQLGWCFEIKLFLYNRFTFTFRLFIYIKSANLCFCGS